MYFLLAIGILVTFYVLFLIWLYRQPPPDLKVKDLKIPKRKFVLLALQWCELNLGTINYNYQLKINYYPNKKFLGIFQSYNKQIIIYIYPDLDLEGLVDTVIHEYVHHLQFTRKSTEQEYNKKLVEVGYWNNPYEQEARKIASRNRKECLKWIFSNFDPC